MTLNVNGCPYCLLLLTRFSYWIFLLVRSDPPFPWPMAIAAIVALVLHIREDGIYGSCYGCQLAVIAVMSL
jgi:hypothetical protein